ISPTWIQLEHEAIGKAVAFGLECAGGRWETGSGVSRDVSRAGRVDVDSKTSCAFSTDSDMSRVNQAGAGGVQLGHANVVEAAAYGLPRPRSFREIHRIRRSGKISIA